MKIGEILSYAVEYGASDLHLTIGRPPMVRIAGSLIASGFDEVLTAQDTEELILSVLTEAQKAKFAEEHELDFSVTIPGVSRFRGNVFMQQGALAGVFRVIGDKIPTCEDLGLPEVVADFASLPRGLICVTGPTGCGKSTTLAALIDRINHMREVHIVTIEDPIEFVYEHKRATINQRELGSDTFSFPRALKSVLREDPDVILVGEMRDLETIAAALTLAETGHLVLSTLHTQDATNTIDRILDVFPAYQQEQIRVMLSATLKGVVSQQLLQRADGTGLIAAREVLVVTPAVSTIIREGKTHQIETAVQSGARDGMCTLEKSLVDLFQKGLITREAGMSKANDIAAFESLAHLK